MVENRHVRGARIIILDKISDKKNEISLIFSSQNLTTKL